MAHGALDLLPYVKEATRPQVMDNSFRRQAGRRSQRRVESFGSFGTVVIPGRSDGATDQQHPIGARRPQAKGKQLGMQPVHGTRIQVPGRTLPPSDVDLGGEQRG